MYSRLEGKIVLYDSDDTTTPSTNIHFERTETGDCVADGGGGCVRTETSPDSISPPKKVLKYADIRITVWKDNHEKDDNKKMKWVVGIKASHVKLVPLLNKLFNRTVEGSQWIEFSQLGTYWLCDLLVQSTFHIYFIFPLSVFSP